MGASHQGLHCDTKLCTSVASTSLRREALLQCVSVAAAHVLQCCRSWKRSVCAISSTAWCCDDCEQCMLHKDQHWRRAHVHQVLCYPESQALVVPLIHLNEATIAGGCHTDDYGVLWADAIQVTCTIYSTPR
jgi:hypothetical protein